MLLRSFPSAVPWANCRDDCLLHVLNLWQCARRSCTCADWKHRLLLSSLPGRFNLLPVFEFQLPIFALADYLSLFFRDKRTWHLYLQIIFSPPSIWILFQTFLVFHLVLEEESNVFFSKNSLLPVLHVIPPGFLLLLLPFLLPSEFCSIKSSPYSNLKLSPLAVTFCKNSFYHYLKTLSLDSAVLYEPWKLLSHLSLLYLLTFKNSFFPLHFVPFPFVPHLPHFVQTYKMESVNDWFNDFLGGRGWSWGSKSEPDAC